MPRFHLERTVSNANLHFVPDREADTFKMPLTAERLPRGLGATELAGFTCTVYMIERIQENPEQLQLITKRLYRETGKKFGVSAASVERNLRTLIHFCWSRTGSQLFSAHCGTDLRTRLQTANSRHACQLFAKCGG